MDVARGAPPPSSPQDLEQALRDERATVDRISEIGHLLAAERDPATLMQAAADAAKAICGAHSGAFTRDFSGREVVRVADLAQEPRAGFPGGSARSFLAVPILSGGGAVHGALVLGHERPGVFGERHERLVVALAAQAAIALENSRLIRQLEEAASARELALREAEAGRSQLRTVFAQAPAAIAIMRGPEHRFESSNELYRQLAGRNPDGKTLREAFPELEGQQVIAVLDRVYATGQPFVDTEFPARIVRPGRDPDCVFSLVYQPLLDARGKPEGIMALAFDVTGQVASRKQIEELAAERELARGEVERRAAYLALQSEVGELLARTESLDAMLQRTAEAVQKHLGAAFARIWTLNRAEQVLELRASAGLYTHLNGPHGRVPVGKFKIGRIAASGEPHLSNDVVTDPHVGDHAWARREGMVSFAGYPLLVEGRVLGVIALFARKVLDRDTFTAVSSVADMVAIGVQRKVDERHQRTLIDQLEDANARLQRSNLELDQFAYVASHDLKAPLRGIANLSAWVEEDLGAQTPGPVREKLDLLRGRVHRMEALIDGILDYSRAGRLRHKPERVEVERLVGEVTELLAPRPTARVEVEPGLPVLETERVPLQQVFLNLVGNALKHARREDARVAVRAAEQESFYRFTVADNGQGIAPEFHERIWGIFQTLESRDKVEGAGIGLSVVRKIVESRGGTTWVESAPGAGAAFHFTWPKHTPENP